MRATCLSLVLAAAIGFAGCGAESPPPAPEAPLFDNLGTHHHPITTASPDAQKYFDQGLALSYAFNHAEAIRAFEQAAALDPGCAMCYWGVAYALGPNINAPITEEAARAAWQAIAQARKLAEGASAKERAYIAALARRYAADPTAAREPLDAAYADAMREVSRQFPDDLEAATLYAQSVMDTSPWNYWEADGSPRPRTPDVLAALESVLARDGSHAGAIHLYIHAVEASPDPGRAEESADLLGALMPGAGHIVHMPAHIYLRVGRYDDATAVNERAIAADVAYLAGDPVAGNMTYEGGYVPHNFHFIVASASLAGQRQRAMEAAESTREKAHADMFGDPGMGGMMQHMWLTPIFTMVRFGMWDELLAAAEPPGSFPYMRAIWHIGRGLAHTAAGRLDEAEKERAAAAKFVDDPSLASLGVSSVNMASSVARIGHAVLQGEMAARAKRGDEAVRHFAQAVADEDRLTYMEPPDWPIPVRQLEGAALLELGRVKEAEQAFRDDMKKFPDNGWSLSGLAASLTRQKRVSEARAVQARFDEQWARADVAVSAGRPGPLRGPAAPAAR